MTDIEREKSIAALRARRAARGMADPLNRLRAYGQGQTPIQGFRQIDARGIWAGDRRALETFADCFAFDCGGCDETFHRVYGWTDESLQQAKNRAFGPMLPDPADSLAW